MRSDKFPGFLFNWCLFASQSFPQETDTVNCSRFCFEIIQNKAGRGLALMRRQKKERFKELCEQAEVQDDPVRLADLAAEIYEMLKAEVEILKKHLLKPA